jgi:SAM-dependent methyltransferase
LASGLLLYAAAMRCPVCHNPIFRPAVSKNTIGQEIGLRERFVRSRLVRKAAPAELKDLTDFMHGFAAPLEACAVCGLLARAEYRVRNAASYSEDANDTDAMSQLFPRYVQAFRNKQPGFRDLLRPCADVLELGSHLGAFLQVAEEWNWRPTGFDVGTDTSEFAKKKGFLIRRALLEEGEPSPRAFDAVFVWNCFEQLADPECTLNAIRRVLRPYGLLVIRVPNAGFYRKQHRSAHALAWNNLLGFPYLYGYTGELVTRLVRRHGFDYVCGFNSELVTMPFPDLSTSLAGEQKQISDAVAAGSVAASARKHQLTGPWIEMVYRRVRHPAPVSGNRVASEFLPRAV